MGSMQAGRLAPRPVARPAMPAAPLLLTPAPRLQAWRDCISDEHYVASLLAFKGQDNATTCHVTAGTFVHWAEGSWHPAAYMPGQVRRGRSLVPRWPTLPSQVSRSLSHDCTLTLVQLCYSNFMQVAKQLIVDMRLSRLENDNKTDCSFGEGWLAGWHACSTGQCVSSHEHLIPLTVAYFISHLAGCATLSHT